MADDQLRKQERANASDTDIFKAAEEYALRTRYSQISTQEVRDFIHNTITLAIFHAESKRHQEALEFALDATDPALYCGYGGAYIKEIDGKLQAVVHPKTRDEFVVSLDALAGSLATYEPCVQPGRGGWKPGGQRVVSYGIPGIGSGSPDAVWIEGNNQEATIPRPWVDNLVHTDRSRVEHTINSFCGYAQHLIVRNIKLNSPDAFRNAGERHSLFMKAQLQMPSSDWPYSCSFGGKLIIKNVQSDGSIFCRETEGARIENFTDASSDSRGVNPLPRGGYATNLTLPLLGMPCHNFVHGGSIGFGDPQGRRLLPSGRLILPADVLHTLETPLHMAVPDFYSAFIIAKNVTLLPETEYARGTRETRAIFGRRCSDPQAYSPNRSTVYTCSLNGATSKEDFDREAAKYWACPIRQITPALIDKACEIEGFQNKLAFLNTQTRA